MTQGSSCRKYCFVSAEPRSQTTWFPPLSAKANLKKNLSRYLPLIWNSPYTENVPVQVASPFRLQNPGETNSPIFTPMFGFTGNEALVVATHSSLGNTNLINGVFTTHHLPLAGIQIFQFSQQFWIFLKQMKAFSKNKLKKRFEGKCDTVQTQYFVIWVAKRINTIWFLKIIVIHSLLISISNNRWSSKRRSSPRRHNSHFLKHVHIWG